MRNQFELEPLQCSQNQAFLQEFQTVWNRKSRTFSEFFRGTSAELFLFQAFWPSELDLFPSLCRSERRHFLFLGMRSWPLDQSWWCSSTLWLIRLVPLVEQMVLTALACMRESVLAWLCSLRLAKPRSLLLLCNTLSQVHYGTRRGGDRGRLGRNLRSFNPCHRGNQPAQTRTDQQRTSLLMDVPPRPPFCDVTHWRNLIGWELHNRRYIHPSGEREKKRTRRPERGMCSGIPEGQRIEDEEEKEVWNVRETRRRKSWHEEQNEPWKTRKTGLEQRRREGESSWIIWGIGGHVAVSMTTVSLREGCDWLNMSCTDTDLQIIWLCENMRHQSNFSPVVLRTGWSLAPPGGQFDFFQTPPTFPFGPQTVFVSPFQTQEMLQIMKWNRNLFFSTFIHYSIIVTLV